METNKKMDLQKEFNNIDEDGEGFVSPADFRKALKHQGIKLPSSLMKSIVGEFDPDTIGQVDYQEFIAFCSQFGYEAKRKSSKKKKNESFRK